MKTLYKLLDNPRFVMFFLPISIWFVIQSYFENRKQFNILKDVLNKNDDFFKALTYYNFTPNGIYTLSSSFQTDLELTDEEIYDIANKQIILTIKNFVKDELLFNIIKVDAYKTDYNKIQIDINTASKKLLLLDIKTLCYSLLINTAIFLIALFIF